MFKLSSSAGLVAVVLCLASGSALADVKLHNKDSKSHDITVKCSSTVQRSIGGSTISDLGKGPCTVTVKATGSSATASGNDQLVIKDGKVGKQ